MINGKIEEIWDEIYSLELQLAKYDEEIELLKRQKRYYQLIKMGEIVGEIHFRLWELYNQLHFLGEDIDIEQINQKYMFDAEL